MKRLNIILIALMAPFIAICDNKIDKTTIDSLDLERYMGTWYEIARFDNRYERGRVGVTAHYTLNEDGTFDVLNSGYDGSFDNDLDTARGRIKQPNPDKPGQLKVTFMWRFYARYNILELDEEYTYALIGSSSDAYLWIISRTPHMDSESLAQLLQRASKRGYDISKLVYVEHQTKSSN